MRGAFPSVSVPGDREGRDGITRLEQKLHPRKPRLLLVRAMCGRSGVCAPRVRFSLLESLDGCHLVWVTAAGCAVSLRSCPAASRAQGGSGSQGFARHVLPSWGNSSEGDSSRGSLSLCFLVFIPCKFFPTSPVLSGVHGREHSSSDSDRGGSALWHPSSVLVSLHLCWHMACPGTWLVPWLVACRTSGAVGKLLMIGGAG